jgi:hypothetical protein
MHGSLLSQNLMASMAAWVGRMSVWFRVGTTLLPVALL